jgi:hypothetical protein
MRSTTRGRRAVSGPRLSSECQWTLPLRSGQVGSWGMGQQPGARPGARAARPRLAQVVRRGLDLQGPSRKAGLGLFANRLASWGPHRTLHVGRPRRRCHTEALAWWIPSSSVPSKQQRTSGQVRQHCRSIRREVLRAQRHRDLADLSPGPKEAHRQTADLRVSGPLQNGQGRRQDDGHLCNAP